MASYKIEVDIDTKQTGKGFKETADDIDKLNKKAKETQTTFKDSEKPVKEWTDSVKKAGDTTKNTGVEIDKHKTKTDSLTNAKKGLGSALSNVTSKMNVFGSGVGKSAGAVSGLVGTLAGLIGLGGGTVSIILAIAAAVGAFAVASLSAAKDSQNEWAAFRGIVESSGASFEPAKQAVKDFANKWGVAVAEARGAAQKLYQTGNYSEENLTGVHEMAVGLKSNMEDASSAYIRIISGSGQFKRTLVQLGIKPEDIIDKTTGKVNADLLNAELKKKYGDAAERQAATMDAAIVRMTNQGKAAMVAFGNILLPAATELVNGLAWITGGLVAFWQAVYVNIKPAWDRVGVALGTLYDAFMSIFPPGSGASAFNTAISYVSWLLISLADGIVWVTPYIIKLGQYLWIAGIYVVAFGQAIYGAALWLWNLPGRIYNGIMSGVNAFVSGVVSVARWFWNLPGSLWNAFVSRIPTLRWPTSGEILGAIRGFLGMSGPAPRGSNLVSQYRQQQRLSEAQKANNLRATLTQTSPTAAPSAPNFGSLLNRFSGPGDERVSYQSYVGHRTDNPWSNGTLTGNCVDMTMGLIGKYGGGFATGTWDGNPHMWYVAPDGTQYDPSRKALDGTWNPPMSGPGDGCTMVIPVSIGGKAVEEFIIDTAAKTVMKSGRF